MSSLAERLAAARRQAEQAAQADNPDAAADATADATAAGAPGAPGAAGDATATDPGPASGQSQGPPGPSAGGQSSAYAGSTAGSTAGSSGESDGRRRQAPKVAEPVSRRRGMSSDQERVEELKGHVHTELVKQLGPHLYSAEVDQNDLESRVRQVLSDVLSRQDRPISNADRQRITQEISDDILGYGPIEPFLRDSDVSEVMVNGHDQIYLERDGRLTPVKAQFADEAHLRRTIDKIVSRIGRRVDESSPMVDARLPDGSRVNAVIPPLAIDGSCLTIRKFATDPLTVHNLIDFGSISDKTADFLDACVRGRLNIIVSGSTGAGKTTTLNVLSSFIPGDERIVTIEDAAELQLKQDHVVRLESRPHNIEGKGAVTIRDLVKNSLRMRPDRIIVGEVRDASALDMLQAMNTGHDGSICTLHSNGPRDTLARMETMVLMAGMDLPVRAIREQVASAVDLIVHQTRFKDGSRRVTHVTEVEAMEGDVITLQDIFVYDHSAGFDHQGRALGGLIPTGLRPKFLEKMTHSNVTVDPMIFSRGLR